MYQLPKQSVSDEFVACWRAAGSHISGVKTKVSDDFVWLKASLQPPMLEHFSFRLGNQLYFVRLEDVSGQLDAPGSLAGLFRISDGCQGHPCIMPMRRSGSDWVADASGWGLVHARKLDSVDPVVLVSSERVPMTDWELHDFAVHTVAQQLEREGIAVADVQGAPDVDPSIWFRGEQGPEWVVVRAVRYPERKAQRPENLAAIAANCAKIATRGHFASVGVGGAEEPYDGSRHNLWRGAGMYAAYDGLERVDDTLASDGPDGL